jgi:RNA polymerase sigma-70 factor (ECF subfamily)
VSETRAWDQGAEAGGAPAGEAALADPPAPPAAAGLGDLPGAVTPPSAQRLPHDGALAAPLDDVVVDAARRGERRAWEAAYRVYGKGLMGFLVLRLGDVEDAAEALSETFLRGLEKVSGFRGDANAFRAWLYRIARNVATDRLRSRSRLQPVTDQAEATDPSVPGPDEGVISSEDAAEVREAFAALPDDDREVLWLRVCAGLSAAEVGDIVGKRAGAVRMQQLRALETLARKLGW